MKPFVMIVEDVEDIGKTICQWIQNSLEWKAEHFTRSCDAIRYCQNASNKLPDILIMDIELVKDEGEYSQGIWVAEQIMRLAHARNHPLGLIYLTGNQTNDDYVKLTKVHRDAFLTKPTHRALLIDTLQDTWNKCLFIRHTQEDARHVRLMPMKPYMLFLRIQDPVMGRCLVSEPAANFLLATGIENGNGGVERIEVFFWKEGKVIRYEVCCYLIRFKEAVEHHRRFFRGGKFVFNLDMMEKITERTSNPSKKATLYIRHMTGNIDLSDNDYERLKEIYR